MSSAASQLSGPSSPSSPSATLTLPWIATTSAAEIARRTAPRRRGRRESISPNWAPCSVITDPVFSGSWCESYQFAVLSFPRTGVPRQAKERDGQDRQDDSQCCDRDHSAA